MSAATGRDRCGILVEGIGGFRHEVVIVMGAAE